MPATTGATAASCGYVEVVLMLAEALNETGDR